jgi:hypothetical protein
LDPIIFQWSLPTFKISPNEDNTRDTILFDKELYKKMRDNEEISHSPCIILMHIFSHLGIYDYGVVSFVLMGRYIVRDRFFVSCGNFSYYIRGILTVFVIYTSLKSFDT